MEQSYETTESDDSFDLMETALRTALRSKPRLESFCRQVIRKEVSLGFEHDYRYVMERIARKGHAEAFEHAAYTFINEDLSFKQSKKRKRDINAWRVECNSNEVSIDDAAACFFMYVEDNGFDTIHWNTASALFRKGGYPLLQHRMTDILEIAKASQMSSESMLLLHIMRRQFQPRFRSWCIEAVNDLLKKRDLANVLTEEQLVDLGMVFGKMGCSEICQRIKAIHVESAVTPKFDIELAVWIAYVFEGKSQCPQFPEIPSIGVDRELLIEIAGYLVSCGKVEAFTCLNEAMNENDFRLLGIQFRSFDNSQSTIQAIRYLHECRDALSSLTFEDFLEGAGIVSRQSTAFDSKTNDFMSSQVRQELFKLIQIDELIIVDHSLEKLMVQSAVKQGDIADAVQVLSECEKRSRFRNFPSVMPLISSRALQKDTNSIEVNAKIVNVARKCAQKLLGENTRSSRNPRMALSLAHFFTNDETLNLSMASNMLESCAYLSPHKTPEHLLAFLRILSKVENNAKIDEIYQRALRNNWKLCDDSLALCFKSFMNRCMWEDCEMIYKLFEKDKSRYVSKNLKILFLNAYLQQGKFEKCWTSFQEAPVSYKHGIISSLKNSWETLQVLPQNESETAAYSSLYRQIFKSPVQYQSPSAEPKETHISDHVKRIMRDFPNRSE